MHVIDHLSYTQLEWLKDKNKVEKKACTGFEAMTSARPAQA